MHLTHAIALFALTSCAASPAPTPAPAAAPAPAPHAAVVQALVGTWVGTGDTPFGEIPVALDFRRDGADVHARFGGAEQYLDFRFHPDGARWLLTEEGKFPGLGVQRHTLVPVGTTARWVDAEDAQLLAVTLALDGDALVFETTLRGESHATFRLTRANGSQVSSR